MNIEATCISVPTTVATSVTNPTIDCKTPLTTIVKTVPAIETTTFQSDASQPDPLACTAVVTLFTTVLTQSEISEQLGAASAGDAIQGPRSNAVGLAGADAVTRAISAKNASTTMVGNMIVFDCL